MIEINYANIMSLNPVADLLERIDKAIDFESEDKSFFDCVTDTLLIAAFPHITVIKYLLKRRDESKLREAKELLLKEAIKKQNTIIKKLNDNVNTLKRQSEEDKQHIKKLNELNQELTKVIRKLQADLDIQYN